MRVRLSLIHQSRQRSMAVTTGRAGGGTRGGPSTIEQFKGAFFSQEVVLRAMDRATAKALSRFGAFVRQRWRTSIRYRKAASQPGQPPSAHRTMRRAKTNRRTGITKVQSSSPYRDFIFFAYDWQTKTEIIGPALLNGSRRRLNGSKTIPETIEYGGSIRIEEYLFGNNWRIIYSAMDSRSVKGRPVRQRTVPYRARPSGQPALKAELPKLPGMFANSL